MRLLKILIITLFANSVFCQELTSEQVNHLSTLPFKCLQQEYPNKLNQLLNNQEELQSPWSAHA